MRRKSRKALLDALLVAYIREYLFEHRHATVLICRYVKSALSHKT